MIPQNIGVIFLPIFFLSIAHASLGLDEVEPLLSRVRRSPKAVTEQTWHPCTEMVTEGDTTPSPSTETTDGEITSLAEKAALVKRKMVAIIEGFASFLDFLAETEESSTTEQSSTTEGGSVGRSIKRKDPTAETKKCLATDCKNMFTKEAKCPDQFFQIAKAEYDCPDDEAKFLCCPESEDDPSEIEMDHSCTKTACTSTLTREEKCPGMNPMGQMEYGCPEGEAQFICCSEPETVGISGRGFGRPTSPGSEDTCIATDCKSTLTREAKCPGGMGELHQAQLECPDDQAIYICCSDALMQPPTIEGRGFGRPKPAANWSEPTCLATECKSTLTREVKCPGGLEEIAHLEYECPESQAKYLCCPGSESDPSEIEKDSSCTKTECISTLTREEKCPGKNQMGSIEYGCPEQQAQFICCSDSDSNPSEIELDQSCIKTECTSTLTREVKCPGMNEMGSIEYGCPESQAQFICCSESNETAPAISGRGFGRPSSLPKDRTCMATDCQSMLTFNLKCPPDFGELAAFEYGCPDNQAKYLCCSGMEPVPDLASECSVSECTSTLTREVKCPGTHEMGQLEYGCEENQAKFVCCPDDDKPIAGRGFGRPTPEDGNDDDTAGTCVATECLSTLTKEAKCPSRMGVLHQADFECDENQAIFICCSDSLLNPPTIGGRGFGRPTPAANWSEPTCLATECKSTLTREVKCPNDLEEIAHLEYECPQAQAKYLCCPGSDNDPSEIEKDHSCIKTDCLSTITRDVKCPGMSEIGSVEHGCPAGQAQFICCSESSEISTLAPIAGRGFGRPPSPTEAPAGDDLCVSTDCKSTLGDDAKCPAGMGEVHRSDVDCGDDEAKFVCCSDLLIPPTMVGRGFGRPAEAGDGDGAADEGGTCMATDCLSTLTKEAKCADGMGELHHADFECPDDQARYICCSDALLNPPAIAGRGFGRPTPAANWSEPTCLATECKSTLTREVKCPGGLEQIAQAEYECPESQAKFLCCPGSDNDPSEIEKDSSCLQTDCISTLTREEKCPGMQEKGKIEYGCPEQQAQFICCSADADDTPAEIGGRGFGRKPPTDENVDEGGTCMATDCLSTLTKESKCGDGMRELHHADFECPDDQAKYICCSESLFNSPAEEANPEPRPEPDACVTTDCQSTLTSEPKCWLGWTQEALLDDGCGENQAKFFCCPDTLNFPPDFGDGDFSTAEFQPPVVYVPGTMDNFPRIVEVPVYQPDYGRGVIASQSDGFLDIGTVDESIDSSNSSISSDGSMSSGCISASFGNAKGRAKSDISNDPAGIRSSSSCKSSSGSKKRKNRRKSLRRRGGSRLHNPYARRGPRYMGPPFYPDPPTDTDEDLDAFEAQGPVEYVL